MGFKIILTFMILFLSGCAIGPKKSVGQVKAELQGLAKRGNEDEIKKYFKENGTYGNNGTFIDQYFFLGDSENEIRQEKFLEQYRSDNRSLTDRKFYCEKIKPGVEKLKCLTQSAAPCNYGKSSNSAYCQVYEDVLQGTYIGKFKIENETSFQRVGVMASDPNLQWYILALKESFSAANIEREQDLAKQRKERQEQDAEEKKWVQYCNAKGLKVISKASMIPVTKFAPNAFWSEIPGVNLNPHCLGPKDDVGNYYGICPHDSHKGCAVIEGLPENSNPNSDITGFISFKGFTTGKNVNGFEVKEVPVWRFVPISELRKSGLNID